MSMSSRKKKDSRAKKAAWRTLLFVNLVAPIVLLVLDKSLPDGLFGRKEASRPKEIRGTLRQLSQLIPRQKQTSVAPSPAFAKPVQTEPKAARSDVQFYNKGSGNGIENTQEADGAAKTTGFSNEGDNNSIKNVQRVK